MTQRQTLKPAGKTLARPRTEQERRRTGSDDVNRKFFALDPIVLPFDVRRPSGDVLDLIDENDCIAFARASFGVGPNSFPETWQSGIGVVRGHIVGNFAELFGYFQQQGGLADLARSRQQLDASGRGLA